MQAAQIKALYVCWPFLVTLGLAELLQLLYRECCVMAISPRCCWNPAEFSTNQPSSCSPSQHTSLSTALSPPLLLLHVRGNWCSISHSVTQLKCGMFGSFYHKIWFHTKAKSDLLGFSKPLWNKMTCSLSDEMDLLYFPSVTTSSGQSTQLHYLSRSIDPPGQILL